MAATLGTLQAENARLRAALAEAQAIARAALETAETGGDVAGTLALALDHIDGLVYVVLDTGAVTVASTTQHGLLPPEPRPCVYPVGPVLELRPATAVEYA